jgi:hypothetical protein
MAKKAMLHEDDTVCEDLYWPPGSKKGLPLELEIWCTAHGMLVRKVETTKERPEIIDLQAAVPESKLQTFAQDVWWRSRRGWLLIADMDANHIENVYGLLRDNPQYFTDTISQELRDRISADPRDLSLVERLSASFDYVWMNKFPHAWMRATPLYKKIEEIVKNGNSTDEDYRAGSEY